LTNTDTPLQPVLNYRHVVWHTACRHVPTWRQFLESQSLVDFQSHLVQTVDGRFRLRVQVRKGLNRNLI
jgi:hypothetical protein